MPAERTRGRGARATALLAMAAIIVVLLAATLFYVRGKTNAPAPAEATGRLAVLPFTDMSANKDQEYFSDGLTEELTDVLARNPKLKVISRTSAFSFKGKTLTSRQSRKS